MITRFFWLFLSILVWNKTSFSYYTPHFYEAAPVIPFPRPEKEALSSFEIRTELGHACHALNGQGNQVPILALYPGTDLISYPSKNAQKGYFSTLSFIISYIQNFKEGLYLSCQLPIRSITLFSKNPILLESFAKKETHFSQFDSVGLDDTTIQLGWSHSNTNTKQADFADISLQGGLLIPTGKKRNPKNPLSIPFGYNGQTGIILSCSAAIGYFEWLTAGLQGVGIFFFQSQKNPPSELNPLVWVETYLLADHFARGLSFGISYSFVSQTTKNSFEIMSDPLNTHNPLVHGWQMQTVSTIIEYDFTKENWFIGPRIGFIYRIPVAGKRIFKTGISDVSISCEVAW